MSDSTGMTIDEATPDTEVGGAEKIPISDNGTPKSVTTAKIRDFVVGAIAAVSGVEAASVTDDSVYILRDGELKRIGASLVADAVIAVMFNKVQTESIGRSDVLSVQSGGAAKTVTLGEVCDYVQDQLDTGLDIHGMQSTLTLDDEDEFAVAHHTGSGTGSLWTTLKVSIIDMMDRFFAKFGGAISTETSAIGENDMIVVVRPPDPDSDEDPETIKVRFGGSGIGSGDVKGPPRPDADTPATTENNIPQWSDEEKKLKNGLGVTTSVDDESTDVEVPTAKAVYDAVDELDTTVSALNDAVDGKADGPSESTDGRIAAFDGNTGKVLKQGPEVLTSIPMSEYTDSQLMSAKMINNNFAHRHDGTDGSNGSVPQWNGIGGLKSGLRVLGEISAPSDDYADCLVKHNGIVNGIIANRSHVDSVNSSTTLSQALASIASYDSGTVKFVKHYENSSDPSYSLCVFAFGEWFKTAMTPVNS